MTDNLFRLRVSRILEDAICKLRKVAEDFATTMECERTPRSLAAAQKYIDALETERAGLRAEAAVWKDRCEETVRHYERELNQ